MTHLMTKKRALISAAVSGLFALAGCSESNPGAGTEASGAAAAPAAAATEDMEKCYGIVKAGANDCAGPGHTCQGQAATDASPDEFILLPAGTCERMNNGVVKG